MDSKPDIFALAVCLQYTTTTATKNPKNWHFFKETAKSMSIFVFFFINRAFQTVGRAVEWKKKLSKCFRGNFAPIYPNISLVHLFSISKAQCAYKEKTGGLYWKKFPPPGSRRTATLLVVLQYGLHMSEFICWYKLLPINLYKAKGFPVSPKNLLPRLPSVSAYNTIHTHALLASEKSAIKRSYIVYFIGYILLRGAV